MTDRPTTEEARPDPRAALERLLAVALTEEEDWSPATQDEWIAAIRQASEALAALPPEQGEPPAHVHEWVREYAPNYRQISEADDWREECACGAWRTSGDVDRASSPAAPDVRSPRFRDAVQLVFDAPGEWGPAQGYYRGDVDHFIDLLAARLSSGRSGLHSPASPDLPSQASDSEGLSPSEGSGE